MTVADIGALCFGVVVGWIVYRTLRRRTDSSAVSDVATVIGAVGGAAVTAVFKTDTLFGFYSIGLAAGFFVYLITSLIISGSKKVDEFMG